MNDTQQSGVREASRLTRAGRLTEATALLQRVLHSGRDLYSGSGNEDAPPTIDLVPDTVEVTTPGPSLRSGQEFGAGARSGAERRVWDRPEALRRFFDRITRTGFQRGSGGTAEPPAADTPDAPEGGKFLAKSYSNEAGNRAYKLYVPSRYRGQPLPWIIMLHGCTQSPDDFAAGTRMNLNAEEHSGDQPALPQRGNRPPCRDRRVARSAPAVSCLRAGALFRRRDPTGLGSSETTSCSITRGRQAPPCSTQPAPARWAGTRWRWSTTGCGSTEWTACESSR